MIILFDIIIKYISKLIRGMTGPKAFWMDIVIYFEIGIKILNLVISSNLVAIITVVTILS